MIGVTGGIATGKSFVLECLRKFGFEVFNSDHAVHALLMKDGKAFKQASEICPEAVTETGIDRQILGEKVFSDPSKLAKLESLLHPLVREAQTEFLIKAKNNLGKSTVFEVPLLFENKREQFYDFVIVTTVPKAIQKERALARKNMTEEKLNAIIAKQMPDAVKIKKADFVVNTGKTPDVTLKIVKGLVHGYQSKRNSSRHRNNRPLRKER